MAGSIVNKLSRLNETTRGIFAIQDRFLLPSCDRTSPIVRIVSFRFLVKCANSTLGFEIQDYFIFHIIFPNADIKIVPLRSILSNPDEYYCSETVESSILGAIIHPRYIRTDSFSETQKSATFFPSSSFFPFPASLYPGSPHSILIDIFGCILYRYILFFHSNFYSLFALENRSDFKPDTIAY